MARRFVRVIPTSPAAFSSVIAAPLRLAHGTRREAARPIWPVALTGTIVAFLLPMAGAFLLFVLERTSDEYAALLMIAGLVVGTIASVVGACLSAFFAWLTRWHSRRAMWISGVSAAIAAPLTVFFGFVG